MEGKDFDILKVMPVGPYLIISKPELIETTGILARTAPAEALRYE